MNETSVAYAVARIASGRSAQEVTMLTTFEREEAALQELGNQLLDLKMPYVVHVCMRCQSIGAKRHRFDLPNGSQIFVDVIGDTRASSN